MHTRSPWLTHQGDTAHCTHPHLTLRLSHPTITEYEHYEDCSNMSIIRNLFDSIFDPRSYQYEPRGTYP